MGIKNLIITLFASCAVAFCGDGCNDDDLNCTEIYVYGLNVTLKNSETNEVVTSDVTVTAVEGDYQEELMLIDFSPNFVGAGERPGLYIIHVTSPNYENYTSDEIFLDFDGCHVIPQALEILLQPIE